MNGRRGARGGQILTQDCELIPFSTEVISLEGGDTRKCVQGILTLNSITFFFLFFF